MPCLLIFALACGNEAQQQAPEQDIVPDSVNMDGMVMSAEDAACLAQSYRICEVGIPHAYLGLQFDQMDSSAWTGARILDQVVQRDGFKWMERRIILPEDNGQLVLEGLAVEAAYAIDSLLSQSTISRIRIESPVYETGNHIKIGTAVSRLFELYPDAKFEVISLMDYETISLQVPSLSGIIYQIRDEANQLASGAAGTFMDQDSTFKVLDAAVIPKSARISAIVVM